LLIFNKISELQTHLADKSNTAFAPTISFVPTMGGLHAGHLSLVKIAKQKTDLVIVSIFLNPAQFGKNEDLGSYPQSLEVDIKQLKNLKVDILFAPNTGEIYPESYQFDYDIGYLGTILCGKSRPQFFPGIVRVVYRLFDIIKPNIAVFGKKDFQQFLIIKQLVKDFNLDIKVIGGNLIREKNGLALSTRNNYLNDIEIKTASKINDFLQTAKYEIKNKKDLKLVKNDLTTNLKKYFNLDYCEILNADNLGKINANEKNIIILVAAMLGKTRLIDNIEITL
jgi:pantoate--beta-alanine ligase